MHPVRRTWSAFLKVLWLRLALACFVLLFGASAQAKDVVVFAAASLRNALDDIRAAWKSKTGKTIAISYAGSNVLAKQIEAGAPADIFFPADLDWMDYAASKKLVLPESRVNLLGNSIVLIAPKDSAVQVSLHPGADLASLLGSGRLAMGHVDAVPSGKYAKAALQKLGAWEGVRNRTAQTENVRAALFLVSRGEAPLGIVYKTDALSDPDVTIVATFPESSHPAIVYPVALTADSDNPDASPFLSFLRSSQAKSLFERYGFTIMNMPGSGLR
jgi:molybdate transport system substrate-binding protein